MKALSKIMDFLGSIQADKLLHLIAGMLIVAVVATIPLFANGAILFAFLAGFGKEVYDHIKYRGWDWWDLIATVMGGAVMQVLVVLIR